MVAALEAADDRAKKIEAVNAHLERMRQLRTRVKALYDGGMRGGEAEKLAAVDFFIAEAERLQADIDAVEAARDASQAARTAGTATAAPPARVEPLIADPVAEIAEALRWLQASSHGGGANRDPNLLYDGQSFHHWQSILKTDLSLEKRTEAVRAMGAFGVNGFGPEAAKAVLAVMRGYSIMEMGNPLEGKFKKAALAAVAKIPRGEAAASR